MFVLQTAVLKGVGGIDTAIAHYERMFRAGGVPSALLFRGPGADRMREQGFRVIEAPRRLTSYLGGLFPYFPALKREVLSLAGSEPLVILVHSDLAIDALRGVFPDAALVAPCHSDKTKRKRKADLVVTLNPEQDAAARAALPGVRVAMLGNPYAPPPRSAPVAPTAPAPAFRANFLGRFEGFKDPGTLVRAFLAAKLPAGSTLRLVGAGGLEAQLRELAGSDPRIEFAGWVADPYALFGPSDVLVFPSTWESYSYVIREALDFGVPCLASDIPVHREALGDGAYGRLFPTGDAEALAEALARAAIDLAQLRKAAAAGGAAVRARYGAEGFLAAFRSEVAAAAAV